MDGFLYDNLAIAVAYEQFGVSPQLDTFSEKTGLVTTTALSRMSQEALTEWVADKAKRIWHTFLIKANEIHAYVTNAEPRIKERIARAKERGPGHNELLPVDGAKVVRYLAMATAAILAIRACRAVYKGADNVAGTSRGYKSILDDMHEAQSKGVDVNKAQTITRELETELRGLAEETKARVMANDNPAKAQFDFMRKVREHTEEAAKKVKAAITEAEKI